MLKRQISTAYQRRIKLLESSMTLGMKELHSSNLCKGFDAFTSMKIIWRNGFHQMKSGTACLCQEHTSGHS